MQYYLLSGALAEPFQRKPSRNKRLFPYSPGPIDLTEVGLFLQRLARHTTLSPPLFRSVAQCHFNILKSSRGQTRKSFV